MKRWLLAVMLVGILIVAAACSAPKTQPNIVATTMPVYTFTQALCENTALTVSHLVQENISCLHDYTLTVKHMTLLESADLLVISGAGLESFLEDAQLENTHTIDASHGIKLICGEHTHEHGSEHHHDADPHYWLSVENAMTMAQNIYNGLVAKYPQHKETLSQNMKTLEASLQALQEYAVNTLSTLNCRELITFHDGFAYMAEDFDLTILKAIEEESGSEASAKELVEICNLITEHDLSAIFTEQNGSESAATVICRETGATLYRLDMAISGNDYFDIMYQNINTLKEALG